jgi:class 3 adenylate cyclase
VALVRALCPVLVGREAEITELEDALLAAIRGEGRVALLAGEAGVGKTRLATELGDRARGMGAKVLSGACSEAAIAMPYLPFLEALGNHVARTDLATLRAQLGRSANELGNLFPRLGPAPAEAGDPTHAKLRFFEAILHLLEVIAGESGLLLVIEDLHGADSSTRELMDFLARRLEGARVLLLGTYRADELGRKHPLMTDIQAWRRNGLADVVELKTLDVREVEAVVEAIFDEPGTSDVGSFLHERSEGNPFVLEELIKEALDRGDIFHTERGWRRKELSEFRLPSTVRDAILLRLERLDADQVRMLKAAAVLGDRFRDSALVTVAGQDLRTVQAALRACVEQQLVREEADAGGVYRFRHSLTRDAVYEDLLSTERQEYHDRAAEALRALPGTSPVVIAGHLIAAGRAADAVPLCLAAAGQAEETWAMADAAELYERALPYVHEPLERAALLERLGRCLQYASRAGAAGAAEKRLEEAVRLYEEGGRRVEAARVRVSLAGSFYPRLRHALAEKELQRAIEVLEPLGPSAELADAYNHLSFFRIVQIDGPGCAHWAEKALAAAEASGAGVALVRAQNLFGLGLACEGRVDEAIECLDRSAAVAVERGWSWFALAAMNNTLLFLPLERWDEVPARVERMRAVDANHFTTLNCQAMLAIGQGVPARAAEIAETARQTSASREWAVSVFWTNCTLVHAYAALGRLDEARSALPPAGVAVDKQDQLSRWTGALQLAVASGDSNHSVEDEQPVDDLVAGWPWALERVLALQALVDLGAVDRVQDQLNAAPDTAFFRAVRIDIARARQDYASVIETAPAFVELTSRVGAWLFANRALMALAEAAARSGSREAAAMTLKQVMASANEREHWWQQRQARQLAQKLDIKLEEVERPARTAEPAATGERFVTVLFADVRGYTELSLSMAPAVMADKIASLQRSAAREVARHHGTVDKFAGDAVMATFNVSGASVDHASHALRAAVALRDRARYMGIALGIGIATGPAIVGRLSKNANLSVLGETTNLASRLQAQAGPNQIVLSEEAWRRLRDRVDAQPEMLELKGFARPVPAYRLS